MFSILPIARFCLFSSIAFASTISATQGEETSTSGRLLSLPEPPAEHFIIRMPIPPEMGKDGLQVVMRKDGEGAGAVVITVEKGFDRSSNDARVAAIKGYANGTVEGAVQRGFRVASVKRPEDPTKIDLSKPVRMEFKFYDPDGNPLLIRSISFFTDAGYNIQITGKSNAELDRLEKWAEQVRPFKPEENAE